MGTSLFKKTHGFTVTQPDIQTLRSSWVSYVQFKLTSAIAVRPAQKVGNWGTMRKI